MRDPTDKMMTHVVLRYGTLIQRNTFSDNMSGQKGTAILTSKINEVQINENEFMNNGPVFGHREIEFSPYYRFLAHKDRLLTFFDEELKCRDEFEWYHKCAREDTSIDMPST